MSVTVYVEPSPEGVFEGTKVNMSNTNAAMLFRDLQVEDFTEDWCGSMEPLDFAGRVLVALALANDSGTPSATHHAVRADGTIGATFIDCGIQAGYKHDRFLVMLEVAADAQRLGRKVVWA